MVSVSISIYLLLLLFLLLLSVVRLCFFSHSFAAVSSPLLIFMYGYFRICFIGHVHDCLDAACAWPCSRSPHCAQPNAGKLLSLPVYCNVLFICFLVCFLPAQLFGLCCFTYSSLSLSPSRSLTLCLLLIYLQVNKAHEFHNLHQNFVNILPQIKSNCNCCAWQGRRTLRMLNAYKINKRFCGFWPQGQAGRQTNGQMSGQNNRQADRETDGQTERQTGRQADSICGWSVTSRNWQAIYRFIFAHCQITSTDYFITKA